MKVLLFLKSSTEKGKLNSQTLFKFIPSENSPTQFIWCSTTIDWYQLIQSKRFYLDANIENAQALQTDFITLFAWYDI